MSLQLALTDIRRPRWPTRGGPARDLSLSYEDEVKLLRSPRRTPWRWALVVGGVLLFLWVPTYVGDAGRSVSIEHFGASADYKTLYREFGITTEAVVAAAKESLAAAS